MEREGISCGDYSPDVFPPFVGGIVGETFKWSFPGSPVRELPAGSMVLKPAPGTGLPKSGPFSVAANAKTDFR